MRLEDATKEELVWWIRKNQFAFKYELKSFSSDILFRRSEAHQKKAREAGNRYLDALKQYEALMSPYNGQPLSQIPDEVIYQAADLSREMERARVAQLRAWKRGDQCLNGANVDAVCIGWVPLPEQRIQLEVKADEADPV